MRKSEEKREKFKRLASARTNSVLNRLRVLGNCSNRNVYEYSQDDVEKIFDEIEYAVKEAKGKFRHPKSTERFSL